MGVGALAITSAMVVNQINLNRQLSINEVGVYAMAGAGLELAWPVSCRVDERPNDPKVTPQLR